MIRVNLLEALGAREGRIESVLRTGGASAFISRREVLLGFACLGIAGALLFFQLGGSGSDGLTAVLPADEIPIVKDEKPLIRYMDEESGTVPGGTEEDPREPSPPAADVAETGANRFAQEPSVEPDKAVRDSATPTAQPDPPRQPQTADAKQPAATGPVLSQLVVSSEGGVLRIFAVTGTQPEYSTFLLDNPKRVVVDLPGVRLTLPRGRLEQSPDHPQVSRIRAGQYQTNPPRARIVLDVSSFPDVEILPQFNGLYLVVTERSR